jgi:hypothetical protein
MSLGTMGVSTSYIWKLAGRADPPLARCRIVHLHIVNTVKPVRDFLGVCITKSRISHSELNYLPPLSYFLRLGRIYVLPQAEVWPRLLGENPYLAHKPKLIAAISNLRQYLPRLIPTSRHTWFTGSSSAILFSLQPPGTSLPETQNPGTSGP